MSPERKENWSLIVKGAGVTGEVRVARAAVPFTIEPVDIFGDRDAVFRQPSVQEIVLKRLMDFVVVLPMILFFTPLMIAIAIAIKLDNRGPALFEIGRASGRESVCQYV